MPITMTKGKRSCVKYPVYPISQFHQTFIVAIDGIKIPASVQEAIKNRNWVQTMREEMKTLKRNSTWDIVDKPKDKRVVGCSVNLMVLLIDINQDWLQRDTHRPMTLTMRKHLPP
ncbi:hypothetical protein CR513_38133, partial [Mucuna pruriens]